MEENGFNVETEKKATRWPADRQTDRLKLDLCKLQKASIT